MADGGNWLWLGHAEAVAEAVNDRMNSLFEAVMDRSMQITLLLLPLLVILGWALGVDDMNLYFDGFQTMILFVSVLLVNYLIQDGKSNYLEGNLLLALYLIIAYVLSSPARPKSG